MNVFRQKLSLTARIMLLTTSAIMITGLIVVLVTRLKINDVIRDQSTQAIRSICLSVVKNLDDSTRNALDIAELTAERPDFIAAIEARDTPALQQIIRKTSSLSIFPISTVTDAKGIALARVHNDKFGDNIADQSSVMTCLKGLSFKAIEEGKTTLFTVRGATPIKKNGELIGTISFGHDIVKNHAFVDEIKQLYDVECTIFKNDVRVTTTIQDKGNRIIDTKLTNPAILDAVFKKQQMYFGTNTINGGRYVGAYNPIKNTAGAVIGILFVGQNMETTEKKYAVVFYWVTAATLLGAILSVIAAYFVARRVSRRIHNAIDELRDVGDRTSDAAGMVANGSQQLAEGATEQASSLEETGASLEEMSSMTQRNTDQVSRASALAKETRSAADVGNNNLAAMSSAMERIHKSAGQIANIIKTIDEIAFQTNILALNAAVEAARAGEAGAGFAIVADEVRTLAQRSAKAAKDTAEMINEANQNTTQGVQISEQVQRSLGEIVAKVHLVDEIVHEVATAINEQSQGIGQVNTAVSQMDQVTQANAAQAEESASAADELAHQAKLMGQIVHSLAILVDGGSASAHKTVSHDVEDETLPPDQEQEPTTTPNPVQRSRPTTAGRG